MLASGAAPLGPWKTAIVFWGVGSEAPGWLVACLSEFAERGVNLTRIESRPRKQGLGSYMFFVDIEGHERRLRTSPPAWTALREHVERLQGDRLVSRRLSTMPVRGAAASQVPPDAHRYTAAADSRPWPPPYHPRHSGPRRFLSTSGAGGRAVGCSF